MRILFDIVHPADVLFFYHSIKSLQQDGHECLIVSREKDVACDLLDEFGFSHVAVSTAASGTVGLALELLRRDYAVLKQVRSFSPNIMIGFGGVCISHVGKLLGIPAISFYAADTATLQNAITWPFITHLYVPDSYAAKTPEGRTTRFKGIKELSYFHPDNFVLDEEKAAANGWSPNEDNYFIRTVMWRANHDIGKSGWSDETLIRLIEKLSQLGRVHISSERPLPAAMEPFRYRGAKTEVHHLMAKCRLYVGESATMAQEAAFLGTQAIYDGHDVPGTTQSMIDAGMLSMPNEKTEEALFTTVDSFLIDDGSAFRQNRNRYLNSHPNLTAYILKALERHAKQ